MKFAHVKMARCVMRASICAPLLLAVLSHELAECQNSGARTCLSTRGASFAQLKTKMFRAMLVEEQENELMGSESRALERDSDNQTDGIHKARVVPEAFKYKRDAGSCHVLPEALGLWQCREFCALLHNYPSDCKTMATNLTKCCEFVPNTEEGYKVSAKIALPAKVLTVPRAKDEAKRVLATTLSDNMGIPIIVAAPANGKAVCAAEDVDFGVQANAEACEEVARVSGATFFGFGKGTKKGGCVQAKPSVTSCPAGFGKNTYDFYQLEEPGEKGTSEDQRSEEDLVDPKGQGYRGKQTKTKSGLTCQRWDAQKPHGHSITSTKYPDGGLEGNYCRNPDGEPTIWCYTTYSGVRWETCVPLTDAEQAAMTTLTTTAAPVRDPEDLVDPQGVGYRGKQTKTRSGRTCQAWDSQSPHSHKYTSSRFPDGGLDGNYCRNPDGEPTIWCYTDDKNKRWEFCDPLTAATPAPAAPLKDPEDLVDPKGVGYRGMQTETRSGRTCQAWDSQSPHRHTRTSSRYPDGGLDGNYCRNPDGEPTIWCYTEDSKKRWEYCDPLPSFPAGYSLASDEDASSGATFVAENPSPGPLEVVGAWIPVTNYDKSKGQSASWCKTVGREGSWQYKYEEGGKRCGGYWCCKRGIELLNVTDRSRDVHLSLSMKEAGNEALLTVSVSSDKADIGALVQSSMHHLSKHPNKFVITLLHALGLATKEEVTDQCGNLVDACECVFQAGGCMWSNGTCKSRPPGPACSYPSVQGSLQGPGTSDTGLYARPLAETKCTQDAGCRGISCLDGTRCSLKKEGTVHPELNASSGLLLEIFLKVGSGKTNMEAFTNSQKFKDGKPDRLELLSGNDFQWQPRSSWIGARFTGTFKAKATGVHHFWIVAGRHAVLLINGTEVARCNRRTGMGQTGNHPEQYGTIMLEQEVPTKVEVLYFGDNAWWANYVQLFFAEPDPAAVSDELGPASYFLKSQGNQCLDMFGGDNNGASLGLWRCKNHRSANQVFAVLPGRSQEGTIVYNIKTEKNRKCFRSENGNMKLGPCGQGDLPLTAQRTGNNVAFFVGGDKLCCKGGWRKCDVVGKAESAGQGCQDFQFTKKEETQPDLKPVLVPLSLFKPDIQPASYSKDCQQPLLASCDECDRQPQCPVSALQQELDGWCRRNTPYPLARKVLQSWKCFSDSIDAGLDFKINGICVDSCGFPILCPGGVRGSSVARDNELSQVLLANQDEPCADTSVPTAQDPDELYGSLLETEASAPHIPILAVSLQNYLDDLCSATQRSASAARLVKNTTDGSKQWACVTGVSVGGNLTGMCTSDCGTAIACAASAASFREILDLRPQLLLNAANIGMKHFCKRKLTSVSESDTLVTFRLGHVDSGALHEDADVSQMVEEVIAESFAEKVIVEPQTIQVSLGTAKGNCVRFRATQNCDPNGELMPDLDQGCEETVMSSLSGYCECVHGLVTAKSNCSHGDLVCSEKCNELLGKTSSKQQENARTPEKKPYFHVRTYQAEDATLIGLQGEDKPKVLGGKFYHGYTGSGFVSLKTRNKHAIQWQVNVQQAGKYTVSIRYSYSAKQAWYSLKDMTLQVNDQEVTKRFRFTATSNWGDWQKAPMVVTLTNGSNLIRLIRGSSYNDFPGPYVDALTLTTFAGATEWNCAYGSGSPTVRLNEAGEVEGVSKNGKNLFAKCEENLKNPVPQDELKPIVCGYPHSKKHGWWNWGWEYMNHWCWKARKSLFSSSSGSVDVDGVDVRVVIHTSNPTQAFNVMRRVQVVYGDEVLPKSIEQEIQSLPSVATFTTGDVLVVNLLAAQGTRSTEPRLAKTAVKDAYWQNTGQMIHWPCGSACSDPSGRHVKAWGVGPIPVAGGEFMYGERHYHSTKGSEKLKWMLHSPLGAAQDWSFHMRIMLEERNGKRGSFVLWGEDGQENYIEFDIRHHIASDKLTGNGPLVPTVYVSGDKMWTPPNFKVSEAPTKMEWHDVTIGKKDCTISVFIDGKLALANIPQHYKIIAVGFWPRSSGIRIINLGMTGKGPTVDSQSQTPFCKMYLDQTVGFRVMRKGQTGCLKVTGTHSPVETTMNMKECTYFYFKEGSMRDSSSGRCLDWYRSRKTYGLWTCHGGSNQRFGPFREVEGKYQFMRFCLGHFDCLDELDFKICPKLKSPCECSEYPKVCGWDKQKNVCSVEKKDEPIPCSHCDRQPKCAGEHLGHLQSLSDAWCKSHTKQEFPYARLLYHSRYLTQRWACFSQTGLPANRNGKCMDKCGYPVECGAGPTPHNIESLDVHERLINEVLLPNVNQTCDDPFRYSKSTCAELGWGPGKGREEVCAGARGPLNRLPCGGKATFSEAAQRCRDFGARLCTETELEHDEAKLAGCALEKTHVWSKHANCSAGQEQVMPAASEFTPFSKPQCMDVGAKAAVVCCADVEKPHIHIHPKDLKERTPPTPLTIKVAVWAVQYTTTAASAMCLRITRGILMALPCSRGQTLFASKDDQLYPWEENSGTPLRTHLCLEAGQETVTAKACTMGAGDRLTLTDEKKLFIGDPSDSNARCLSYDDSSARSMGHVLLETDQSKCGAWTFKFKHRVSTPTIVPQVKSLIEKGDFDDEAAEIVVQASIERAKEEAGDTVSGAFWDWLASVKGMQLSLASTSFPIHAGTVMNLYRLWLYFGTDWDDTMSQLVLAMAYKGRDRNVLENDVAFAKTFGVGIHKKCGCKSPNECGFPAHRGSLPKGGEFLEYYLGRATANVTMQLPLFEGGRGAPWPLLIDWRAVPLDECQYHLNNGYSPGEYTFRYGRHEIMCKKSDWHPDSGPRIAQDGGVCGRLSYLSSVGHTCSGVAPSKGVGQPGHAAGFRFQKDAQTGSYEQTFHWKIYDERVSSAGWHLALTENLWGQHGLHKHEHLGRSANTQWHKTLPTTLSLDNGQSRWEKGRLAAMVALQASYWHDVDGSLWMQHALSYDPYSIEVWEYFRTRIQQGKTDELQALDLWSRFKQSMVTDAPTPLHALAEHFFFTVVDSRTCDSDMLAWQVSEADALFALWRASPFDVDAAEAIFMLKQMECAIVLHGLQTILAHDKYGKLMQGLLDETVGKETLNLEGRPYGGGIKGVLKVLDIYLEKETDRSKRLEAIEWIKERVRPGMMQWDLFGKSYFYWMQYDRVIETPGSMISWIAAAYSKLGEDNILMQFQAWVHSCLTQPWNHTQTNSKGIVYDGCYGGKNGEIEQVKKFMDWMIPYHASGFKKDSCFPDWALKMLRMAGHALLQKGSNASRNEGYEACIKELETSGSSNLSAECRQFLLTLQTDEESGHTMAEEGEYINADDDSGSSQADGGEGPWEVESFGDLPDWEQKKFQAALPQIAGMTNVTRSLL